MNQADSSPGTLHALLIGINSYPVKALSGCLNDIDSVQSLLTDRLGISPEQILRLASPCGEGEAGLVVEREATLAHIRAALDELTTRVADGDRVLVYYSGHGTRVEEVRDLEHVFYREGLVPVDVDFKGDLQVLYDHELNQRLRELAGRAGTVTVLLDCCHSAGVTRAGGRPRGTARHLDLRRDLGIGTSPPASVAGVARRGDGIARTLDDCQVVAACLNHEEAIEDRFDGGPLHGLFTHALLRALGGLSGDELATVPWNQIWENLRTTMLAQNMAQHAWMAGHPARGVFGGGDPGGDPGLAVSRRGDRYQIEAGTLSAVTVGARIGVYGRLPLDFPPLGSREDVAARSEHGRERVLRVICADLARAGAVADDGPFEMPPGARGRIITAGSIARLRCAIVPPDAPFAAELVSPLVEVAAPGTQAHVKLEERDGRWLVTDDVHGDTPDDALVVLEQGDLDYVQEVLDQYFRYSLPLRMVETVRDLPGTIELSVLHCNRAVRPDEAESVDLPEAPSQSTSGYALPSGTRVCFRVRNTSGALLRVTLVNAAASGRVQVLGDQVVDTSYTFWSGNVLGRPFEMTPAFGRARGIDRLVAIGTSRLEVDLGYLRTDRSFADILPSLRGLRARDSRDAHPCDPAGDMPLECWAASQAIVTTVR